MSNPGGKHLTDSMGKKETFKLDDPFNGFFKQNGRWQPVKDGLLDTASARKWFKVVGWGSQTDLYTFQQRFDGRSGPRVKLNGQELSMMSAYDYLGLIGHPKIEKAARDAITEFGTGTGGVRLLTGTTKLHRAFEHELATFLGAEAAITFTSGYVANLAAISALLDGRDRIFIDSLAHRSIVDACRLAGVPSKTFRHNDPDSLRQVLKKEANGRRRLIIVEGVYSMDGDLCPLAEIVKVKKQFGAYLMVDEAHSFAALGETGRGISEQAGISPSDIDIYMGSLSKAIPSNGGFLAGSNELIIYLQHGAAPFMFSAALTPAAVASARESLRVLQNEPERLQKLRDNADYLRSRLTAIGYDIGSSDSHVIPVIAGSDKAAYQLARDLFAEGILVCAVVFPAVARGKARLRLCATAAQTRPFLDQVMHAFELVAQQNCLKNM